MIPWLQARWQRNEQLRFLVIGGWNTLFGYLVFLALYGLLHERTHYLLIAVAAHLIAVVNAFVAHRRLVFRSSGPWPREFLRFNLAQLTFVCAGLVALWLLVSQCRLNPLVAQAIVTVAFVALSYFVHRYFSFGTR